MEHNHLRAKSQESNVDRKNILLYVEETQNDFISALVNRTNIGLVILRFSNCMNFSQEHLRNTRSIPSFIWNKDSEFNFELDRMRIFLRSNEIAPDYFYNDSEFNQILAQKIARSLGVPGALTERQAELVRNKILMKQFVQEIGLRCPRFAPIGSLDEAKHFVAQTGYPVIIKWHSGVSSIDVFKVGSKQELESLPIDLLSGRYMIEEFRRETIWCIDALAVCGRVQDIFYTWLPYTNLDFATSKRRFIQMSIGKKQENWNFDPYQLTQTIISGLGTESGYLHLEVFITDKGEPLVCEFAWRTPGDHMISNLSNLSDADIPGRLADSFFGICHEPFSDVPKCVGDIFLPMKNGRVTAISDLETMRAELPIIAGDIFYSVGDWMIGKHKYTDSAGWIQVSAASISEMLMLVDRVYSLFCLKVEEHG